MIEAKPFLKWVGGKRQLLHEIVPRLPKYSRYFEPFIGGGALFFHLQPKNAYITDINLELINVYRIIRDDVHELIKDLKKHTNDKEYFLKIRDIDRSIEYIAWDQVSKASRFIYLNKTCFNGLYRVNSKGQFNVPFGKYANPKILDEENLLNCSRVLQDTYIETAHFSNVLNHAQEGDFVYLDPPYIPVNQTSNFTSYSKEGFGDTEHWKLKEVCDRLTKKGVKFMLSNSYTERTLSLYKDYNIYTVSASRSVNSDASKRGKVFEVICTNY